MDNATASPYRDNSTEASAPYREITASAVVLGIITGILMTASFVYIGLKLGFTLPGSTVAAITGFALLRGVGRNVFKVHGAGSIVENNINQTIASGINTASSGIVFTFPALLLLGVDYDVKTVIIAAIAGSFMGIVVIIPLRKQLIEVSRLRFPSGVAVATILKSPGAGAQKAIYLGVGFAFAATLTLLMHFHVLPETLLIGESIRKAAGVSPAGSMGIVLIGTSLSLSMANFGAGLLSGKGGLPFAVGGAIAWWIIAPFAVGQGWAPSGAEGQDLWGAVYGSMLRPIGIGVLIGGALAGVVLSFPALKSAIKSLQNAAKLAKNGMPAEELPPKVLVIGLIGSFVALLVVALVGSNGAIGTAISVAVAGTIWLGLAGMIVAEATGATDISPLSGLALIAVTLMLAITAGNVALAITIGVAVCIATGQCADMMQDLKTGHLVGSVPRRQQIVQFCVAWIGPAIAVGTVLLIWKGGENGTGGFGPGTALPAPQAGALQGMVSSVLDGNAPIDKYAAGAAMGGALSMFPIGGLGVLIGLAMYLPFEITFGYGIGCLASMAIKKTKGNRFIGDVLIPVAAGLIVGEALTSLTLTLINVVKTLG